MLKKLNINILYAFLKLYLNSLYIKNMDNKAFAQVKISKISNFKYFSTKAGIQSNIENKQMIGAAKGNAKDIPIRLAENSNPVHVFEGVSFPFK